MADTGNLFVIAAASGTGKTTLVKELTDTLPNVTVSISHTTRNMRPSETNGVDYHFVNKKTFEEMIAENDFLEHATVFDNYYGTSKSYVKRMLESGKDVILEIDWQGHLQVKRMLPTAISIFILPPSLEALEQRLHSRNQDTKEVIENRLADAKDTITHADEFDYIVINDDLVSALYDLKTIFEAGRLTANTQLKKHADMLKSLTKMDAENS